MSTTFRTFAALASLLGSSKPTVTENGETAALDLPAKTDEQAASDTPAEDAFLAVMAQRALTGDASVIGESAGQVHVYRHPRFWSPDDTREAIRMMVKFIYNRRSDLSGVSTARRGDDESQAAYEERINAHRLAIGTAVQTAMDAFYAVINGEAALRKEQRLAAIQSITPF